ncbi:MAG: response regulator transcription factor [Chloroflexi bacterium]|nr:response regulator transcription factor [Chloroflexota bacterium]
MIEPDATLDRMAGSMLEGAGYRVLHSPDGIERVELPGMALPQLLVLDVGYFQQESLKLLEEIRALNSDTNLSVIITSIYPMSRSTQRSYGINVFLQKPYDMKRFLCAVRCVLVSQRSDKKAACA